MWPRRCQPVLVTSTLSSQGHTLQQVATEVTGIQRGLASQLESYFPDQTVDFPCLIMSLTPLRTPHNGHCPLFPPFVRALEIHQESAASCTRLIVFPLDFGTLRKHRLQNSSNACSKATCVACLGVPTATCAVVWVHLLHCVLALLLRAHGPVF